MHAFLRCHWMHRWRMDAKSILHRVLNYRNRPIRLLEQADALDHVAGVIGQESIQIGLRIAVVGAPAGDIVEVVVGFITEVGVVAGVVPGVGINALNQVDDHGAAQDSLNGLLQGIGAVAESFGTGEVGDIHVDGVSGSWTLTSRSNRDPTRLGFSSEKLIIN